LKIIVPPDHGATDALHEEEGAVIVRPHHYEEDTYVSLWFTFQVVNDTGRDLTHAEIRIESLPPGPDTYQPFWKYCLWSRDGQRWERIPQTAQRLGETTLTLDVALMAQESLWIAETFPLPYGRYLGLCEAMTAPAASGCGVQRMQVGSSAQGRPLYAFCIQREAAPADRNLLLLAGQHAVEQSGKIFAETVLRGYHSGAFAGTAMETLLQTHNVYVAPLVNPDGCYDGRMNSNAEGIIVDTASDNSVETRALLAWMEEIRPAVMVNCHGWGNEVGTLPHEDLYRWTDEDPFFAYLRAHILGCNSSGSPHLFADHFRLENQARARYGTECVITELNWNWYVPPKGGPACHPTWQDIEARAVAYFTAIARYCAETSGQRGVHIG
jgi:hypothetical protein